MIERLKTLQTKPLTDYHQQVVGDFVRAVTKWGALTPRQIKFLSSIEEEYNPEAVKQREEALVRLRSDEQYRKDVKHVCQYYKSTGYYRSTYEKALRFLATGQTSDAPDPRALDKMMNNKYATNILASINSEPKFTTGELVKLRAHQSWDNIKSEKSKFDVSKYDAFMVIEVDSSPVTRSLSYHSTQGGSRWYKVLALGGTETFEIIERALKRPTKKAMGKK